MNTPPDIYSDCHVNTNMPDQEGILANDIIADKQILNRKDRAKKKEGKEKFRTRVPRAWQVDQNQNVD
jgi:hypothetical protein